ncbi:MAG: NUDIX domain-containing protein [Candidatus ainarchaeum sp.]|nr:NUDIX domain-containing protein [Candidatus ainarchaeum sp.]
MNYRKSVLAIIFNESNEFLMIREGKDFGFVQGGIEENETEEDAVNRELKEELNLTNFKIIRKCNYKNKYDYPKEIQEKTSILGQEQTIFLIRYLETNQIKKEEGISKIKWFKEKEVFDKLPYENLKLAFRKAMDEIKLN